MHQNHQRAAFFNTTWQRMQPQLIAGYFVGAWGLIQFVDWLLVRYQLSPYWLDVLLVFFLSLLPSLFIYTWNLDRIRQGKLRLWEKLFFPGNLLVSLLLLLIIFRGTDLGATTRSVSFTDEMGAAQYRTIVKPGFRKKLAIHNFLPEKEDSLHQWLRWGINSGIAEDISQNGYMTVRTWNNTQSLQEMITRSREEFFDHYLTGTYSVYGNQYEITTRLYQTRNGALKESRTFRGGDFFALLDTISLTVKKDMGLSRRQLDQFVDLPFADAFTSRIDAFKNFVLFQGTGQYPYLEQAIALDTTFAFANYVKADYHYGWSTSKPAARESIRQGMRHRQRLPENLKLRLKTLYFQVHEQPEKAIATLNMQMEMDPANRQILETLTSYLYLTERYQELLTWRKKLADMDAHPELQIGVAEALILNGRMEEAGQIYRKILDAYPNQPDALVAMTAFYALTNQIGKAEDLLEKIVILDPDVEVIARHFREAFQYAKVHPLVPESLGKYSGHYRLQAFPAEFDIKSINNLLYGKGSTQKGGFFMFPSGPDEFVLGNEHVMERWTFNSDSTGWVYNVDIFRLERSHQTYDHILWRQDSLIQEAMGLFKLGKQAKALDAFKKAYEQNPRHFYLKQYIRHLEYVLDPNNKNVMERIRKFVGRYGPRHIWIEHSKIYYERIGQVSTQRLLPVADGLFYFEGGYEYLMQVVVENGRVKGTVSWKYDPAIGEFVRDDEDYIGYGE